MGSSNKRKKIPKVVDATILSDGCLLVEMNVDNFPQQKKVMLTPELIQGLVEEYGEIPAAADTDFPGVPIVDEDSVFSEDEGGETERPRAEGAGGGEE